MKILFGIIVVLALSLTGYLVMRVVSPAGGNQSTTDAVANNVTMVDGQQIVEITAKGGYTPRVSTVKAGVPTILRINTKGTFDCSSQIRVPSLDISQALPPSGVTDIALGTLKPGTLDGTCGMGMYPFQLNAEN